MVSPAYLPETSYGGPVFYIRNLVRILGRRGDDVTVHTSHTSETKPGFDGVQVYRYPILASIAGYRITSGMYGELIRHNPDVIHAHCARSFQLDISAVIASSKKIRLVVSGHGAAGTYLYPDAIDHNLVRIAHIMHNPILRWSFRIAHRIVALNNFESAQYRAMGVPPEKIRIIPVAIDLDEFRRAPYDFRERFQLSGKIILFVGRQSKIKGLDVLQDAYRQVMQKMGQPTVLVLAMAIAGQKQKANYSKDIGMHKEVVLLNPSRDDIVSAYHACDIVALPSFYETFPTVILEAYACHKPVVATNVGGIPELVHHGFNGFLTEVGNAKELASFLVRALEDEEACERMGENGGAMISKFSLESVAPRIFQLYEGLV